MRSGVDGRQVAGWAKSVQRNRSKPKCKRRAPRWTMIGAIDVFLYLGRLFISSGSMVYLVITSASHAEGREFDPLSSQQEEILFDFMSPAFSFFFSFQESNWSQKLPKSVEIKGIDLFASSLRRTRSTMSFKMSLFTLYELHPQSCKENSILLDEQNFQQSPCGDPQHT